MTAEWGQALEGPVPPPVPRERGQRWAVAVGVGPGRPALFGPFFSAEQAEDEAKRWNRKNWARVDGPEGAWAAAWPMGSLKALRDYDP